tara:strand:+ start:2787 stop:3221 length:435 start_codon:yes stop_codon:yes gene_type:complete
MSVYSYIQEHVNVKIAPSKLHGVGIFALRDIEPGENLFVEWQNPSVKQSITQKQLESLPESIRSHIYDMFEYSNVDGVWEFNIYLEKDCYWIFKTPTHWINSCSWDSQPNVDLIASKALLHIKNGTELLTKYGKYQKNKPSRVL